MGRDRRPRGHPLPVCRMLRGDLAYGASVWPENSPETPSREPYMFSKAGRNGLEGSPAARGPSADGHHQRNQAS